MPLEIEQKFRVDSHDGVRSKLQALGATAAGIVEQADQYYAHPSRDFRQTGEALRVRRWGGHAVVTYKGPKLDTQVKTRPEIELPLACAPLEFSELLTALGFVPVAEVTKRRERFTLQQDSVAIEVALDEAPGIGSFVEVEAIADQAGMNPAREAVVRLAGRLGLSDPEPRSYLRMLLELRGQ